MHLACDRGAFPRELFASVFGMALFSDSFSIGVSYGSFCCGSFSITASAPGSMLSLVFSDCYSNRFCDWFEFQAVSSRA